MTVTQLRTLVTIAETGSVRAAADELMVSPSAVSSALSALQQRLDVALVVPEGRGLRLTDAGRLYAHYARRILGLFDEARNAAVGEAEPGRGELRLAAITTAGEQLVPRLLAGFTARYGDVGLRVEVGNRQQLQALLDAHEVDLGIGGRPDTGRDLEVHGVRRNELVVVAGPDAEPGDDPVGWLARRTWLLRERGSGTRATTAALFERLQVWPRTLTLGSNVAAVEAVSAGLGVTLVSKDAVARQLEAGALTTVDIPGTPLRRDWHLVAHSGHLPATARLFVGYVLQSGEFVAPSWRGPASDQTHASGQGSVPTATAG